MFSQLCITPQYHIICILGHSIMASSGGGVVGRNSWGEMSDSSVF